MILIRAGARTGEGVVADSEPLTRADANELRKQLKENKGLLNGVAEVQQASRLVQVGTKICPTAVVGTVPDLRTIRNWIMSYGRYIDDEDVKKKANVCVVGETVRKKLFGDNQNPVGKTISVDRKPFRIIGIQAPKGRNLIGADQDNNVTIPISTLQQTITAEDKISLILAGASSDEVLAKAQTEIEQVLRKQHHLKAKDADKFDVSSVKEMSDIAFILTSTMQILITIIASISLLVGGIGIMNIMLVSVTERTREIGIRMAVGATPEDVLVQFLIEAMVLALIGGALGITVGIGGAIALAYVADWPWVLSGPSIAIAFLVSAGVGVFFGYYPRLESLAPSIRSKRCGTSSFEGVEFVGDDERICATNHSPFRPGIPVSSLCLCPGSISSSH